MLSTGARLSVGKGEQVNQVLRIPFYPGVKDECFWMCPPSYEHSVMGIRKPRLLEELQVRLRAIQPCRMMTL